MTDENQNPQVGPFVGQMGPHTARAIERLKTGKPGDTVTRDEMAQVIGRDCSNGSNGGGNVRTAIKRVLREYGIYWEWVKGIQAWRCQDDDEKVTAEEGKIRRSRRQAKGSLQIGVTIDSEKLTPERRRDHQLNQAAAGMGFLCQGGAFRKKLTASGFAQLQEPDPTKLIELMKR